MRTQAVLVAVQIVALPISAQNTSDRANAQRVIKEKMAEYFQSVGHSGIPARSQWTPSDEGQLSVLLDHEIEKAKARLNGAMLLGTLDCLENVETLSLENQCLKAQVAWTEGFFAEAEKASKQTPLGSLFSELSKERQSKLSSDSPALIYLMRGDDYTLIGSYVSWPPFRDEVLKNETKRILDDDSFLTTGTLPVGFHRDWLANATGPTDKWDSAWNSAWQARDVPKILGLLRTLDNYRPNGLSNEQKEALSKLEGEDWGLPYTWVHGSPDNNPRGIFNEDFVAKVKVARLIQMGQVDQAESELSKRSSNPRDEYELSRLRQKIGTEESFKGIVAQGDRLLADPHVLGWTASQARTSIDEARLKVEQFTAERAAAVAEAARQAEAERQAEIARKAEIAKQTELAKRAELARKEVAQKAAAERAAVRQKAAEEEEALNQWALTHGVIRTSVSELNRAYQGNEVAADEQFRGNLVMFDCRVGGISKDIADEPYLTIQTGEYLHDIQAKFDASHNGELAQLRVGMRVRIIGRVSGMILGSVILEDCRLFH